MSTFDDFFIPLLMYAEISKCEPHDHETLSSWYVELDEFM